MKPMSLVLAEAVAKALSAYEPARDTEDDPEITDVDVLPAEGSSAHIVIATIDGTPVNITIEEDY